MSNRTKPATKTKAEITTLISDFGVAYFYLFRVQLLNAQMLQKDFAAKYADNHVLRELMDGYRNSAVTEFCLNLFDIIEQFRDYDPGYQYPTGGNIDAVTKFRRHILAHRGRNWESDESREVRERLSQDPTYIIKVCFEAAKEFLAMARERNIKPNLDTQRPAIPTFRVPQLQDLMNGAPKIGLFTAIPSEDELVEVFGKDAINR